MAEETGKVVLMGKRFSGRSTVANMLVNGKLNGCLLEPIDATSICQTYIGRGWTMVDTMGFGDESIDGSIPDEYAKKMAIDFLNEVKSRYSHIVFVMDLHDILYNNDGVTMSTPTPIIWNMFLEIFRGGERNFVVLVTGYHYHLPVRTRSKIEEIFPECKQFLYVEFPEDEFPEIVS